MGPRVLVVDDDPQLLRAVRPTLAARGFEPQVAESGEAALELFERWRPDVVLLDLGLPGMDGLAVIRRIREHHETPIVVLSARGGERDKVAALDLGADDYLTKPFGLDELLARLRVALRHAGHAAAPADAPFRAGDLEVDLRRRRVRAQGQEVHLSPTEWSPAPALRRPPRPGADPPLPAAAGLGAGVRQPGQLPARLRRRPAQEAGGQPARPRHLLTEPGVGYRFRTDPA